VRDPDDEAILATALEGRAEVIVTGDDDLLSLGQFEGIPIVKPRAFLDWLEERDGKPGAVHERPARYRARGAGRPKPREGRRAR
jgi:hypothetical protein